MSEIMTFLIGCMCGFAFFGATFESTRTAHEHEKKVIAEYQCEKVEKGRYIEVDGKKKCVVSIDFAR